jgi:hypothetical protein
VRRLAALAAAVLGAVYLTAGPASASIHGYNCVNVGSDAKVCLEVYGHNMSGGGMELDNVYLETGGGFWESKAVDCDWVAAWNDNGVTKWRKDNGECDVYKDPGYRVYSPSVKMPGTSKITVVWAGYPKLDKEVDPGYTKVKVVLQ